MSPSAPNRHCPHCGAPVPADAPLGLCPACLLATAVAPVSQVTEQFTDGFTDAASGKASSEPPRLAEGVTFGAYTIARLLGRGGMGEVYEAVADDGRRVALKVLRERLHGDAHREQFLREGALAASVTDRHCVYVYGAQEIEGVPVIAMELAPQGTLKQQVDRFGPKSSTRVVEDVLEVIAGLKAAAATGILHRDVKPSNCFIDADGAIKIGDFGLSVSLDATAGELTWKPAFQGTPEYAAPEQLRGEPLDVRADIYGVGATLYFLLTGYSPFRERNIAKLLDLKTAPKMPSPADLRPDILSGLSELVERCLSADPNRRPQSYDELTGLLQRFTTSAPAPATLFMRFSAMFLDQIIVGLVLAAVSFLLKSRLPASAGPAWPIVLRLCGLLYFALWESRSGATPGKRLCGLRVVDEHGRRPAFWRAATRWLIVEGPNQLFTSLRMTGVIEQAGFAYAALATSGGIFQLLSFFFARSRADAAMFHDLWTGTRVVEATASASAPASSVSAVPTPSLDVVPVAISRLGPFDVLGRIGTTSEGDVLLGRDARLQRFVWIHRRDVAAPVSLARKELAQPSRLRWLLGGDTWDAFDAPDGRSALSVCRVPQSWDRIKNWLVELSRELEAAEAAGVVPTLAMDRIWITTDGRAMLLDFPAPGLGQAELSSRPCGHVPEFLTALVDTATNGARLSRGAAAAMNGLRDPVVVTAREAVSIIGPLPYEQQELLRWRRSLPIAICLLPVVTIVAAVLVSAPSMNALYTGPDSTLLLAVQEISQRPTTGLDNDTAGAMMQFVADRFRDELAADPAFWKTSRATKFAAYRAVIERTMFRHPPVSPFTSEQARRATERRMAPRRSREAKTFSEFDRLGRVAFGAVLVDVVLVPMAILSVLLSLVGAGPLLLRFTGHAVVDANGDDAGIWRRIARAVATWSPLLLMWPIGWLAPSAGPANAMRTVLYCVPGTLLAAGAIYALVFPDRAIQDRIAGTYIAPK